MNMATVSLILPTRNRFSRLQEALTALEVQTLKPFETIVIDDGSTDGTAAFLAEWAAADPDHRRVIRGCGRGPAAARNLGVRSARGDIIAMTDDDCLPEPGWLSALVATLEANPGAAAVGGRTLPVFPENLFSRYQERFSLGRPHTDPAGVSLVITNNAAFRRTAIEAVDGFDETHFFAGEDRDLSNRLRARGFQLAYTPEARIRHHNITDWQGFVRIAYKTGQGELLIHRRGSAGYKILRTAWWGRRLLYWVLIPGHARRLGAEGLASGEAWRFATLYAVSEAIRWFGALSQWRHIVRGE